MITIELEESDVFKIMVGSLEDRVKLLISDSVMKNIDVKTIKNIIETEIEKSKKNNGFDDDKLAEVIMLFQIIAYNRYKSKHSEEIATFLFDKLFEIITHDFW